MIENHWLFAAKAEPQTVEKQVDDWRGVECQHLAYNQTADDRDSERAPQFGAGSRTECQRQCAKQGSHCRHQDGTEAKLTSFKDSLGGGLAMFALCYQGKVNHHDRVLFHDADQQNDADD